MVSDKYEEEEVEDIFEEDEIWPEEEQEMEYIKDKKMVKKLLNIVVRPGDSLFFYAQTLNVSVHEILAVNPGIIDPDVIYPGQIVRIPARPPAGPDPGFARAQYLVRRGDSLFRIAQMFGLTVNLLIQENPQIVNPNLIHPGQVINLPVTPPLPPKPPKGTIQIYVSVTETLSSIARHIGVSVQAIIDANPQIQDPNLIFVGQIINVPLS